MLAHVQLANKSKRIKPANYDLVRDELHRLLRENEYQRLVLAKRIVALRKKLDASERSQSVVDYLNQSKAPGKERRINPDFIIGKKNTGQDSETETLLMKYEIKKELLDAEKLVLELKIEKFGKNLENIDKKKPG